LEAAAAKGVVALGATVRCGVAATAAVATVSTVGTVVMLCRRSGSRRSSRRQGRALGRAPLAGASVRRRGRVDQFGVVS